MLECQRSGVAVHVAGVFNTGLLVGGETYAYQIAPEEMVTKARRWGELATVHGVSLPAVALAFCALPECVERLVIGIATLEELQQVSEAGLQVPGAKGIAQHHIIPLRCYCVFESSLPWH